MNKKSGLIRFNSRKVIGSILMAVLLVFIDINGQENKTSVPEEKPCFFGTSLFTLINLLPDPPVYFGQIDFGYHFTKKDVLVLEMLFWRYTSPMGNASISGPEFPGSVFAYGMSFAYQRFFWKGFYTTFHLTPLVTVYSDESGNTIQTGFQPWLQLRPGYHFKIPFVSPNFFIEPSLEFSYWPINLNMPADFEELENDNPNFLFAPGLNIGYKF